MSEEDIQFMVWLIGDLELSRRVLMLRVAELEKELAAAKEGEDE